MKTEEKIAQVDRDIKSGKKRTAMNRLQGLINAYPNELIFRQRLGKLYHELGFKEYAGQYWILLPPETEAMKEAVSVYRNSHLFSTSATSCLERTTYRGITYP